MGKVVEGKKEKKGRPSLSDVRKRTLKEQKRNHKSAPHSASNYPTVAVPIPASGLAPLRRFPRLNPIPDADESDESGADNSDDEIRHDEPVRGTGSMTDDQMARYLEQVYKSDGFDVDPMPDVRGFGLIQPVDLSNRYEYSSCEKISQRAIDEYNRRKQRRSSLKSETPQLKFVRVLKAMAQSCDLVRYYITFETEILTCGGSQSQTKIYRALVRWSRPPIDDDNFSVLSMREYKKDRADQVIGIHSLSELDARLDAASMTSRLAILYFSETHRCRFISPLYTSLSGKYPTVVFLKVDIAEASNVAGRWNIRSAPYFFFLKNGEVVDKVVGVGGTEDILKRKIARHSRKQASKLEVS